jgi:hypothetical protein
MAVNTVGTKLLIDTNTIAEVKSISGFGVTKETFESSNLETTYKEYTSKGIKEFKEFSISGFYEPNDTLGQKAMYDALIGDSAVDFSLLFANVNAEYAGEGFVTDLSIDAEYDSDDGIAFEATIRPTGEWSQGLTASGGLTALSLTGTGGTLSPAFAVGERSYAFYDVTATSFTVTATAAAHTLKLFVDGTYVQDLTSASASSAISISAGESKKVTILAYESGKTRQVTDIIVTGA